MEEKLIFLFLSRIVYPANLPYQQYGIISTTVQEYCRRIMGIFVEINQKSKLVFLLFILDMLLLAGIWEKTAKT